MDPISSPTSSPAGGSDLPLLVGLPLLLVIVVAIAALLLLLLLANLRLRLRRRKSEYRSVPNDEPEGRRRYSPSHQLRPNVRVPDPPPPSTLPVIATKLTKSGPYPYPPHQLSGSSHSSPEHTQDKARASRLPRRGKSGTHKHSRDKHKVVKDAEHSVSSDSLDSFAGTPRKLPFGSSAVADSSHLYMVPAYKRWTHDGGESDCAPKLSLALLYSEGEQRLVVRIERVLGLPLREDGTEVDAYVRVYLVAKSTALPQRRTSRTRTSRRDSAPVFDEEISYEAMSHVELINSALHLEVLDFRPFGKHRVLGRVEQPLGQVSFQSGGQTSLSLQLSPPKVSLQSCALVLLGAWLQKRAYLRIGTICIAV